ncbi:hypothetical protein ACCS93_38760 [Rhizobium ruizarguesonis]
MFDADDPHMGNENGTFSNTLSTSVDSGVPSVESRGSHIESHVVPARSALTFLTSVSKVGLQNAIQQEIRARQLETSKSGVTTKSQDPHNRGAKGSHLSSAEIAENFIKNGAGLTAAELVLLYIDTRPDYFQGNENSGSQHGVEHDRPNQSTSVAGSQEAPVSRPRLDDRSHGYRGL